jgi:hypothetical protein
VSALIKRQYRGDPGLFGFIGKAIGTVAKVAGNIIPGPIGAVAKLAGTALAGNGKPQNPSLVAKPLPASVMPILQSQNLPQIPSQTGLVNIVHPPALVPGVGMVANGGNQTQSGFGGSSTTTAAACERGYHRNKTGYYSKKYGYIPAGSVCVKNRKRNPLNPRALSRSIARISSAKNAAAFLSRVTVREKAGCGCK